MSLDQQAAHSARRDYLRASEMHAQRAVSYFVCGNRDKAREEAAMANRCRKWAATEYPAIRRVA